MFETRSSVLLRKAAAASDPANSSRRDKGIPGSIKPNGPNRKEFERNLARKLVRTLSVRILVVWFVCAWACVSLAAPLPRRGTLGIPFRQVPEETRTKLKLGAQEALQVTSDASGLKADDLVVGVSGKRFKSFADFNDMLRSQLSQAEVELLVSRDGNEQTIKVPVKPKPSDVTDTYETVYDEVVSNGHRIRTFVTKPKMAGKHPVFFWIQGIGTGSVDFPLSTKNYMAPFIKAFADDGYVTVRVEKPGVGDSEGGPAKLVGYDEELDIYRQAFRALDRYDFVDRKNVFVFGHSMGGCHAPLVGMEQPIRGIVSYGTVSNSWLEWEIRSPRIQSPLGGKSRAEVDREVRQTTQFYNYLFNEKRSIDWIKTNHPELKEFAEASSPDGVMLGDRSIQYMQEVNDKNFCDAWAKLGNTKVLALFGENDWISLREDQTQVADTVNAAHPNHAEFQVLPEMDHLFSKCTSMQDSFGKFGKPGAEFNPEIVRVVKNWVKSNLGT